MNLVEGWLYIIFLSVKRREGRGRSYLINRRGLVGYLSKPGDVKEEGEGGRRKKE
jgi:hypothetical protein